MKRLSLILITAVAATFAFSTVNAAVKPVKSIVKPLSVTPVGYQTDGEYVYTFFIDPSTSNPHPIAAITVVRYDGLTLDVSHISGSVNVGFNSIIAGTASVTFLDPNGNQVTVEFTGGLQGGVVR